MKIYQKIAQTLQALENCKKTKNQEWEQKHMGSLTIIEKNLLPCGSGFDSGTTIMTLPFDGKKIQFETSFHHMDENGFYCGWTDHVVTIKPSFPGFDISISGKNKNDIKEYIADVFVNILENEYISPVTLP